MVRGCARRVAVGSPSRARSAVAAAAQVVGDPQLQQVGRVPGGIAVNPSPGLDEKPGGAVISGDLDRTWRRNESVEMPLEPRTSAPDGRSLLCTWCQPTGESERWTDPPSAVATNWLPKHIPEHAHPASTARRTVAIRRPPRPAARRRPPTASPAARSRRSGSDPGSRPRPRGRRADRRNHPRRCRRRRNRVR